THAVDTLRTVCRDPAHDFTVLVLHDQPDLRLGRGALRLKLVPAGEGHGFLCLDRLLLGFLSRFCRGLQAVFQVVGEYCPVWRIRRGKMPGALVALRAAEGKV